MQSLEKVFNRYDLRGEYPTEIDETFSYRLGVSAGIFANSLKGGLVVVGGDTRQSTDSIKKEFIKGLNSQDLEVLDVGISSTDKVALLGKKKGAVFSVMVTASHHSYDRNGFKFMYREGNGFLNEDMDKIKKIFREIDISQKKTITKVKNIQEEADNIYFESVEKSLEYYLGKNHKTPRIKIIVDACNGGAFRLTKHLFKKYGFNFVEYNCNPNINKDIHPEPTRETRIHLKDIMKREDADMAVGYDLDADRIYMITKKHEWIDGDEIFLLLAKFIDAKKIVASLDTSQILEKNLDAKIEYARIGDIFVSEKALRVNADFLGEPNGHYAFPHFCIYNSAIFASLILALKYPEIDQSLRSIIRTHKEIKSINFKDHESKIEKMNSIIRKIELMKEDAEKSIVVLSTEDGIKFKMNDSVCLIRPSGTSNKIRIIIEDFEESSLKENIKFLEDEVL